MINTNLRQKGILIVALPVVLTTILTVVLLLLLIEAESQLKQETFAAKLVSTASQIQSNFFDASSSIFIYHMTRSELQQYRFDTAVKNIKRLEKQLAEILVHNEKEKKMANEAIERNQSILKLMMVIRKGAPLKLGGNITNRMLQMNLATNQDDLGKSLREIIEYGKLIEKNAPKENAAIRSNVLYLAILIVVLNLVLAFVLSIYFTRNITGRLNVISENAIRLASNIELVKAPGGDDEITKLDDTFREMAIRLDESRRKEKALIDNAVNVLASIDKELKFINVSQASEAAWGYKPDDLIGMRVVNLFQESEQAEFLERFNELLDSFREETFDTTLLKADGELIETRWDVHWSNSEDALFCVITDITEEKRLQELKQRLMDTVAHDLRTPISSIRATLSLINMGVLGDIPEKVRDRASKAETQSDRLIRLINDLLDFERLDSGGVSLNIDQTTLETIIFESVDAVSESAREAGVTINTSTDQTAIEADVDRLIQVLVNLLGNAIKFSEKGSEIKVKSSSSGKFVQIQVIDRGPGIPQNQISSVFDRFKMVEGSERHRKPGSGLGLSIAKEIVELHGGTIGAKNNNSKGCTFWFTVPIKPPAEDNEAKN